MIEIKGAIHAVRMDSMGQWKLTLEVPASDGQNVAALAMLTEKELFITFKPVEER